MAHGPRSRAEEERVLSHVRRIVVFATTSLAALLPLFIMGFDGAKRW